MDLLRIVEAGRKHWVLLAAATLVGVALALVSSFKLVTAPDGTRIEPRAQATYQTRTRLLITEPNLDVAKTGAEQGWPNGYTKTVYMAPTYAQLLLGDEVRRDAEKTTGGPLRVKLSASAVKETPVIELRASGTQAEQTTKAARAVTDSFIAQLSEQQDERDISQAERVKVVVLSAPSTPRRTDSSALEVGALALLAPLLAALGLAVSIENGRRGQHASATRARDRVA